MKSLTRRTFIKTTLGLGAAAPALFFSHTYSQAKPLILGLQADLMGSLLDYGYWHDRVVRAAIKKLNQEGGIAGREIQLLVEDTETNSETGRRKLQKMADAGADFVIGSQSSAVAIASLPLAQELKLVYFTLGEATEITGEAGNRYIFRPNHSVRSHATVAYKWAVENLGKRWTILVADYAFGQSHAAEWPPLIKSVGGEVLNVFAIPLSTQDFVPFLSKVDRARTEVLFHVFPGANALRFMTQAAEQGLFDKAHVFGVICTVDGIRLEDVPKIEGSWYLSNHPHRLEDVPAKIKPFDEQFRQLIGATAEGNELNTNRSTTGSHYWYGWEAMHLLKRAVEETNWKSKSNNPELIKFLEGIKVEAGLAFPQGDKFIRAEDHQAFHDHYIERFEGGKLRVKLRLEKEKAIYAPLANYSKQGF
ncbi:ABC transporter substrate-binding protein [Candidatus Acetothermia bacterium]|nr:ABC transporter substrate-binding protein [Candidatus Acetothermia bacterium]